jgi:hypothetical protein
MIQIKRKTTINLNHHKISRSSSLKKVNHFKEKSPKKRLAQLNGKKKK